MLSMQLQTLRSSFIDLAFRQRSLVAAPDAPQFAEAHLGRENAPPAPGCDLLNRNSGVEVRQQCNVLGVVPGPSGPGPQPLPLRRLIRRRFGRRSPTPGELSEPAANGPWLALKLGSQNRHRRPLPMHGEKPLIFSGGPRGVGAR